METKIILLESGIIYTKYVLNLSSDFISFIRFLIYLENIILNCCGLNYNIKDEIEGRSNNESYGIEQLKLSLLSETVSEIGDESNDTMNIKEKWK